MVVVVGTDERSLIGGGCMLLGGGWPLTGSGYLVLGFFGLVAVAASCFGCCYLSWLSVVVVVGFCCGDGDNHSLVKWWFLGVLETPLLSLWQLNPLMASITATIYNSSLPSSAQSHFLLQTVVKNKKYLHE